MVVTVASLSIFLKEVYGQIAAPVSSAPSVQFSSFNIKPSTITLGQSATVTWATTNASSCATSAWWPPGATNYAATSGSQVVTPTSVGTYTYTMQCVGPGNTTASQSATLTVSAAAGSSTPTAPGGVTSPAPGGSGGSIGSPTPVIRCRLRRRHP